MCRFGDPSSREDELVEIGNHTQCSNDYVTNMTNVGWAKGRQAVGALCDHLSVVWGEAMEQKQGF